MVATRAAVLLAALVTLPTFLQLSRGQIDVAGAAVHFFLALVICWVACNALSSVTASYWAAAKSRPSRADNDPPAANRGGSAQ